ncbi:MAG: hypothetical protein CMK29_01980 [Porticoccaceae bacterium]|nr:hypothetical protein [Porticoccaceae bacterium]
MAEQLYFSRDSKVYVRIPATSGSETNQTWEIPVLDGFSFSQATNTSEVTLNEMASDNAGTSKRGRKMFNDSLAPADWSFQTYLRPYRVSSVSNSGRMTGVANDVHAVEEILWALLVGQVNRTGGTVTGRIKQASDLPFTSPVVPVNLQNIADGDRDDTTLSAVILTTVTDGNGGGAKLSLTYTVTGTSPNKTGVFTVTIDDTNRGSGYDAGDKLFVSKEAILQAMNAKYAADNVSKVLTQADISQDLEVTIDAGKTESATTGVSFDGFTRGNNDGSSTDADLTSIGFGTSNKTTLGTAEIFFDMGASSDNQVYKLSGCVVNEASVDFDIDGIATVTWTGNANTVESITDSATTDHKANNNTAGTTSSNGVLYVMGGQAADTSNFIRNKLSRIQVVGTSTTYDLVLTGGAITFANNVTYLTPETLGVVNSPIGHITGARNISGNFTCYLNQKSNSSADLFKDLITGTGTVTNEFAITISVGGTSAAASGLNTPGYKFTIPKAHLEVPTHSIEDVISIDTNFHGLPSSILEDDEATIAFLGPVAAVDSRGS